MGGASDASGLGAERPREGRGASAGCLLAGQRYAMGCGGVEGAGAEGKGDMHG